MNAASAYKALCQEDKLLLLGTAQKVAMLVDKSKKMDYFRKQIREYGKEWKARKTAYDAERKGKWKPSMGKQGNPFSLEAPWRVESMYGIRVYLTAYALLAVIHDKVLPHCPSIAKGILPKELINKIWHNLITGSTLEDSAIIPDATYYPRRMIPQLMIENFLGGVEIDIENHFAPQNSPRKVHPYFQFVDENHSGQKNGTTQKLAARDNLTSTKQNGEKTKSQNLIPILQLIEQGESHTLEFKETLEYSVLDKKQDKNLNKECLKTIVAFLNTDGGTLLIGVRDNGEITGIERDLPYVQRKNEDGFQLKLRNLFKSHFTPVPSGKVDIRFESFTKGTVCRIDVEPVNKNQIIFLGKDIYIRDGNTTQKPEGPDLTYWIQQRRN